LLIIHTRHGGVAMAAVPNLSALCIC